MKNVIVLILLFVHNVVSAQLQWARTAGGDTSYNLSADVQLSASFTDGQGNTYIKGNMNSKSATFGSHVLTIPGFFIVKYDAAGTALWAKDASGGGSGKAVCTDAGGNVYVSGTTSTSMTFGSSALINTGVTDIFVVKYDPAGNVLWAKSAVGTGSDNVTDIAADAGGNVVITGFFTSPALSFGMHHVVGSNFPSWYMAKYDANGSELWAKGATGGVFYNGGRQSLAINSTGEIYLGGSFTNSIALGTCATCSLSTTPSQAPNIFLAKYDTSGNGIWARAATGIGNDMLNDVALDAAGNLYATGKFDGAQISFGTQTLTNSTNPSMFLVKYDSAGNNIWAHRSVNKGFYSEGFNLATDGTGSIYLTGVFGDTLQDGAATIVSNGQNDVFIAKYSGVGSIDWVLSAGGSNNENALGLGTDAAGNVYAAGWFNSPAINFGGYSLAANFTTTNDFTVKFDATGNTLWATRSINTHYNNHTDAAVSSMRLDTFGNVCVTGVFRQKTISFGSYTLVNTDTSGLTKDIFVVKYDPSGAVLWAKSLGSPINDSAHAVVCDAAGNIYIGGTFFGPVFTAGAANIVNSGAAYQDGFLVKLDASGGTLWAKKIGGADHDAVNDITTDAAGNILVTGFFTMNMMVDNFPLSTMSTDPNMFVIKFNSGGNALWVKRGGSPLPTEGMGVSTDTMNKSLLAAPFSMISIS